MTLGGRKPVAGKLGKDAERPGDAHEKRSVRKLAGLGAKRQPGSGNQPGKKGDIQLAELESVLFENKTTAGQVLKVRYADLCKITREARAERRTPGVILGFENAEGPYPQDWAALPLEVLNRLLEVAGWDALKRETA